MSYDDDNRNIAETLAEVLPQAQQLATIIPPNGVSCIVSVSVSPTRL